ncbi:MAG: NAD(P)H-dependent glycerol-3-phosphate dehydrogenase [Hyphomonadaceae bacterium]
MKAGILGGGSWGTALASLLAGKGHDTMLWTFEHECAEGINQTHINERYLPGIELAPALRATSDLADLAEAELILAVVPAQHMRSVLAQFKPHARKGVPIVLCSKGIEQSSLDLMTDVLAQEIPNSARAVLSGPSFAADVARGLPTAVTLACADMALADELAAQISTPTFRLYTSDDLIGAEIGGAVKNVLAIACGITVGLEFGKSAHAALIARGFAEMTRLGVAMGAQTQTLTGLCGLGDLILTCSSEMSRNMSCGLALGRGTPLADIMSGRGEVTEGVSSAPAVCALGDKLEVELPICNVVADILSGKMDTGGAVELLMSRPLRAEKTV